MNPVFIFRAILMKFCTWASFVFVESKIKENGGKINSQFPSFLKSFFPKNSDSDISLESHNALLTSVRS